MSAKTDTVINTRDFRNRMTRLTHVVAFLGKCIGVALADRGDRHVVFHLLVEDDGNWGTLGDQSRTSSHWIDDMAAQLAAARAWMEANCDKTQWGWEFR